MTAYCNTCGSWRPTPHACYPVWEVRDASYDGVGIQLDNPWDAASEVRAADAEEAAEKFAEMDDEYLIRSESNRLIVEVRAVTNRATVRRFECHASHSVSYHADEVASPVPAEAGR